MIVLVDLDNTLVDRRAAFTALASHLVDEVHGSASDLIWLLQEDCDGYRPRPALAEAIIDRFHLESSTERLVDWLRHELVELTQPFPGVPARLEALTALGACIVVVTNGTVSQQTAKLARTGLLQLASDVVISEAVAVNKPDRRIFEGAVARAQRLGGTGPVWMIGDHPIIDMGGARDCGLATGWVSHETEWTESWSPTISGRSTTEVLDLLLQAGPNPPGVSG